MLRVLLVWLGSMLLVYAALCAVLYAVQRSLLYFPQPARANVPSFQLLVPGAELQVSVRPHSGPSAVIYFGGNAEDVSSGLAELATTFPEHAVYAMHYRGYGRSTGKPAEAALHSDATALFDSVAREHSEITVIGRSLGSGVAIRLAAGRPVSRLVLVAPYDSVEAVAAQQYSLFPVRWLILDRFDSSSVAPTIRAPTTVILAERDEVIRRERSDALVARFAPGVAQVVVIAGAGHNTLDGRPDFDAAMAGAR